MNEDKKPNAIRVINVTVHGPKGKATTWYVKEGARLPRKIRRAMGVK
jgi:hypothetical protein